MKQRLIICILFIGFSFNTILAQNLSHLGERIIIGSSLTYIGDKNGEVAPLRYHEWTWNKNIAVNLTKNIYVGLSHQNIYTSGSTFTNTNQRNQYTLVGLFTQFDFLPKQKSRLFGELSWNYGNYCTCGINTDPYRESGLQYLGIGGGYDFPILDFLSIDLSFVGYKILNSIDSKYTFTQYIIGLNFDLVRK